MSLPRRFVVLVVMTGIATGLAATPSSAHCSLGPFDAAVAYAPHVWAGEIVDGREGDGRLYELTLRVDEVLAGDDPGATAHIAAQPCRRANGPAPSTIPDYVGITGVFAIADTPEGYFYVETFTPPGDPVAAAEAVLAIAASPEPPSPPMETVVPPRPADDTTESARSSAIPVVAGALALLLVGFGLIVRRQSRKHAKPGASRGRAPARKPAHKGKQTKSRR